MSEVAAMFTILIAGGFLAAMVASDVKRYQTREKNAVEWHARLKTENQTEKDK